MISIAQLKKIKIGKFKEVEVPGVYAIIKRIADRHYELSGKLKNDLYSDWCTISFTLDQVESFKAMGADLMANNVGVLVMDLEHTRDRHIANGEQPVLGRLTDEQVGEIVNKHFDGDATKAMERCIALINKGNTHIEKCIKQHDMGNLAKVASTKKENLFAMLQMIELHDNAKK